MLRPLLLALSALLPVAASAQASAVTARGLVVQIAPPADALLADWRWLVGAQRQMLLVTALGDAFLREPGSTAVYFLDTQAGRLEKVADTPAALELRLADPAFIDDYLSPDAVADMRSAGHTLRPGEVYSMKTPRVLGGQFRLDNLEVSDAEVHFSLLGQIHEQVRDLPNGTPIKNIKLKPH